MEEENKNPRYLYRYMKDSIYAMDLLLNHELCFSHPSEFNDPYDSKSCVVGIEEEEKKMLYENMLKFSEKYNVPFNCEFSTIKNIDFNQNLQQELNRTLNTLFYIYCLSKNNSSPIMWAHYADNNSGVCFEFDISKESKCFNYVEKVRYVNKMYEIDVHGFSNNFPKAFVYLITKYRDWKYENEYRAFKFNNDVFFGNIPQNQDNHSFESFDPKSLVGIYFGYKVKDDVVKRYKKICENNGYNHVKFWKMQVSTNGQYKLIPQKCDIQPNKE